MTGDRVTHLVRRCVGLAAMAAIGVSAAAEGFSISLEHRKFNEQIGQEFVIEPHEGGEKDGILHIAPVRNNPRQAFNIKQVSGELHQFTIDGGTKCMDVVNGGTFNNYVRVAPCGNYSGQSWTTRQAAGGKRHTLTNEFNGAQMCMDVVLGGRDDGDVVMSPCDGRKSQLWGSDGNP